MMCPMSVHVHLKAICGACTYVDVHIIKLSHMMYWYKKFLTIIPIFGMIVLILGHVS
jgi:hypothetical protein